MPCKKTCLKNNTSGGGNTDAAVSPSPALTNKPSLWPRKSWNKRALGGEAEGAVSTQSPQASEGRAVTSIQVCRAVKTTSARHGQSVTPRDAGYFSIQRSH